MRFDLAPSPALANCGSGAASRSADLLSNCLPTCLNGSVLHIGRLLVLAARSGFRLGCLRSQLAYLSPFRGPEGLRQLPVGQILLRQVASQGGLDIVPARPIGASAPCAARPGLGVENFRILFDDPVRVHPPGSRGTEAICNLLRSLKDQEIRRAVATSGEAADGSRSGFAAGTQGGGGLRVPRRAVIGRGDTQVPALTGTRRAKLATPGNCFQSGETATVRNCRRTTFGQ